MDWTDKCYWHNIQAR